MINLYHLARSSICYTDEFVVYALSKVDDLFFFFFFLEAREKSGMEISLENFCLLLEEIKNRYII